MTLPTFEIIAEALSNGQRVYIEYHSKNWPLTPREVIGFQSPDQILVRGWTDEWMTYPQAGFSGVIIGTRPDTVTNRWHFKMDDLR